MAEPEWGQKRLCPTCGVRFYDLTNNPTTCYNCDGVFPLEALSERKSAASRARPKPAPKAAVAAVAAAAKPADREDDELIDSSEDEEEIEADDDVLLDDDEDEDDDLGEIGDVASPKSDGDEDT
ncbi:MAG: FYDLN acid domain-containing protein [Pseudomonadota bacterium]